MITAETMLARRSVRTYDGRPIEAETLEKVKGFADRIQNPFGIPVRFVFLDAKEKGLSSPVLTGEPLYVAGKVDKVPYGDVAFGFAMEELLLFAWSLGLGSVWIGGTMKRELFEKAAGLEAGERMPWERLFFDGDFLTPLAGKALEPFGEVLELVRWAPSAVNKQPWRLVLREGRFHFYLKHDKGYVSEVVGDLQKIDMGIALCHFVLGAKAMGREAVVAVEDPRIPVPEGMEYIASVFL